MGEFRPSKPGERRGGRGKGTPNKQTADIKAMILGALSDVGGRAYLAEQAYANPTAFMSLVGRVLPLQIAGDSENPVTYVIRAPTPVEDARSWLQLHAPSDQREPVTIDADVDTAENVSDETT